MEIKLNSSNWYKDRIQIYKTKWGYRWRVYSSNMNIVGAATENYKNFMDCIRNLVRNRNYLDEVSILHGRYRGEWHMKSTGGKVELIQISKVPSLRRKKK